METAVEEESMPTASKTAPRKAAKLKTILLGGYGHFRWDLLGFGFSRAWLIFCLYFALSQPGFFGPVLKNDAYFLFSTGAVLLAIYLFTRRHLQVPQGRPLVFRLMLTLGTAGLLCSFIALFTDAKGISLIGFPLLGSSVGLMQVLWGRKYSSLPLSASIPYVLYAMALAGLLTILTYQSSSDGQIAALLFFPLLVIALYKQNANCEIEGDRAQVENAEESGATQWRHASQSPCASRRLPHGTARFLAGLFVAKALFDIVFHLGVSATSIVNNAPDVGNYIYAFVASSILLAVYVFQRDRFDPGRVYRFAVPVIIVGSMVLLFLSDTLGLLAASFISIGYKLFDLVYWIMLLKIGHNNRWFSMPLFLIATSANYLGIGLGHLLACVTANNEFLLSELFIICCIVALPCIMVFPEKSVSLQWSIKDSGPSTVAGEQDRSREGNPAERVTPPKSQPSFDDMIRTCALEIGSSHQLTLREIEVFTLLARGRSRSFIADRLGIAVGTAHVHTTHIYQKLGINSQEQLIQMFESKIEEIGRAER